MYLYYLSGLIILNTLPLEVSQTHICPVIARICHPGLSSYLRDVIWCYPSLHPDTTLIPSYPPKPHLTITSHNSQCTSNTRLIAYTSGTILSEIQIQDYYNFPEIQLTVCSALCSVRAFRIQIKEYNSSRLKNTLAGAQLKTKCACLHIKGSGGGHPTCCYRAY